MKCILVLCDGNPPVTPLFRQCLTDAHYFIAADGGADIASKLGATPDIVIGDLDTFKPTGDEPFEIIRDPGQETNDLEKALKLALEKQGTHIQILGATGKRLDHTLKNLSVLKQFNNLFEEIVIKDNFGNTFLIEPGFSATLPIGTQISLFPLSGKVTGITTSGLQFPLKNESLENGVRDGTSNKTISNTIRIDYLTGNLLLFIANEK